MKISEIVTLLEGIKANVGDVEIVLWHDVRSRDSRYLDFEMYDKDYLTRTEHYQWPDGTVSLEVYCPPELNEE